MENRVNFTEAFIRNIAPPEQGQRLVFKDTKIAGLQCRVTSAGVKTFSFYGRMNGRSPERITLGKFTQINVDEARRLTKEIHAAIARNENPAQVKRTNKAEMTFEELFYEYLEKHAKVKKRTWKGDEGRYKLHLKPKLGKKRLSEISRSDLVAIHTNITSQVKKTDKDQGGLTIYKSGTTANRILALASSIFGWAVNAGHCEVNPASGIKKNPERSRDRFLQEDEMPRFYKALMAEENTVVRDFVLMSMLTGARRQNVASMEWKDISFERKEWRIARTKNNDPQVIPLGKEVLEILKNRLAEQQASQNEDVVAIQSYVFPGTGKHGYLSEPRKGWLRILKAANISDLRIHDLRRTFGSWQAKTGASLIVVGKSLGHKSPQATAIYARLDLAPVRDSMKSATSAILKAAKKKPTKHQIAN